MTASGYARLLLLAAVWGGSFLFMRIAVPAIGAGSVVFGRLALGALFMTVVCQLRREPLRLREHWRAYLVLGFFNTGLPFLLFSLAASHVPAGLLSILNATTTFWGTLIGAAWSRQPLHGLVWLGLALGVVGVGALVGLDPAVLTQGAPLAVACGLSAAICYGIGATVARFGPKIPPLATAHGSLWSATLLVLPALLLDPPHQVPGFGVLAALLSLGLLCSGLAYLLYFGLLAEFSTQQVLSVAFLIPLFGVLWGCLFLGEVIGPHTIFGAAAVLGGTAFVNRGQRAAAGKPA